MARVRLIKKTVTRRNSSGVVRREKSSTWYLDFGRGHLESTGIVDDGKRDVAGHPVGAIEQLRAKREAELILSDHGLPLPGDRKRQLSDLVKEFEAQLSVDNCERYVEGTVATVRQIIKECGWRTAVNVKERDVVAYAVRLRDKGAKPRTIHSHLTSAKNFSRWLVRTGKLPVDPLANVKKPSPLRERRRRALLHDEWAWLRKVALAEGKERRSMTSQARILLYATGIQTGLRQGELRSLTRGNLFLDGDTPYITCHGINCKDGEDAKQYVRRELAGELRAFVDGYGKVFCPMPDRSHTAMMLRADLAAAREAWLKESSDEAERKRRSESDFLLATNHSGEVFDFHCLRHTCGAWLALAGVSPKVIQAVMRHYSITLTMDTYGHLFPGQEQEAIAKLPAMLL